MLNVDFQAMKGGRPLRCIAERMKAVKFEAAGISVNGDVAGAGHIADCAGDVMEELAFPADGWVLYLTNSLVYLGSGFFEYPAPNSTKQAGAVNNPAACSVKRLSGEV